MLQYPGIQNQNQKQILKDLFQTVTKSGHKTKLTKQRRLTRKCLAKKILKNQKMKAKYH